MSKQLFVNLPVANLPQAKAFYEALGFENNPKFTDDTAACMVWSDAIFVMLLTHEKWRTFTTRPIPPTTSSEVMLALSVENRAAVDRALDIVSRHGGAADANPPLDYGFMYNRTFADLDGHLWEMVWMDMAAMGG